MGRILATFLLLAAACRAAPPAVLTEEVGSSRNARVALERGPPREQLVFLARGLDPDQRAEIARLAPDLDVVVDLSREEALARAGEAHGIDASYATPEFLREARRLVWIQARSAGVERWVARPDIAGAEHVVLTNSSGASGPAIADHAFAMLLALTRDLPVHLAGREEGRWKEDGSGVLEPVALQGRTMLVVGLGSIGTEIARRAHGFGMRVIATRRSHAPSPDFVERVGRPEELPELLPQADVVAIAVPLTDETRGLFGRDEFAAMKESAVLVNVARGAIVDTGALVDALASRRLGGACLDVTDPEPLPSDHPLWSFPNVVITPHVAADAELTDRRHWELLRENLRRFDAGEPLLNVVDKRAGY